MYNKPVIMFLIIECEEIKKKPAGTLKHHNLVYYANFMAPQNGSPAVTNLSDVASWASNYISHRKKLPSQIVNVRTMSV